ncbi:unnamed protein product [Sympodiomycopsis kandeliae]
MADSTLQSGASPNAPSPSPSNPPPAPTRAVQALAKYTVKDTSKVLVRFKAIGSAPIMKNNAFRITAFNRFQAVIQFLKKELGSSANAAAGSLFLYINNSFSPSPDDTVGNLFKCFGTDGHLIVNYSTTPAFG